MEFNKYLESNHSDIAALITSFSNYSGSIEELKEDIDKFCDGLLNIVKYGSSNFNFDKNKYHKKEEPKVDKRITSDYVLTHEGNSFDLFYDLVDENPNISIEQRRALFKKIDQLAFDGDVDAKAAYAMCLLLGVFVKKNINEAWERLNDYAIHYNNGVSAALLTQYYFFEVYRKNHNREVLEMAKQFLILALEQHSAMAKKFNGIYKLVSC